MNESHNDLPLTETLTPSVSQSAMETLLTKNCEPNSGREDSQLRNYGVLLLKRYNIKGDVIKAVESGNIEEYCKDLAKKLEESTIAKGAILAERCTNYSQRAKAFLQEKRNREELGTNKDGESLKAEFNALPKAAQSVLDQICSLEDMEKVCDRVEKLMKTDWVVFQTKTTEEAKRVAENVSVAAKAVFRKLQERVSNTSSNATTGELVTSFDQNSGDVLLNGDKDKNKCCKVHESVSNTSSSSTTTEIVTGFDKDSGDDLLKSETDEDTCSKPQENESNTNSSTKVDEILTSFEKDSVNNLLKSETDEDTCFELQENGSKSNSSATDESLTSFENDGGDDQLKCESDEDSEKPPITEQEDDHVIPTSPPPPPVKMYGNKVDEINDSILRCRKYQVNQVKKELNFTIARLTSEVVKSYEQVTALQKHDPPSLEKATLDFMQNQETKKTFFIKEISTRVHKVLSWLTPEPEIHDPNEELEELNETVQLLYLLQTNSRKYDVDRVSITTSSNDEIGVLFYSLLLLAIFAIVLFLSLNGEWLPLLIFVGVVFIFMVKSWQGIFSIRKKKVEVFGRVKKLEKIE